MRRLTFDLETSPNIGYFWQPGYKINISHDNIIHERAIICVCYKWSDKKRVHSITWDKQQDDKTLLEQFIPIMDQADEIVAHNGDRFDITWLRTRCLKHKIAMAPNYVSIDTLKFARTKFRFNSNRLDYIASYLGFGGKKPAPFDLWKRVVMNNDQRALKEMVDYCKHDVVLLEKVWDKMNSYVPPKSHLTGDRGQCPECGSENRIVRGYNITAAGYKRATLQCKKCGKFATVPQSILNR